MQATTAPLPSPTVATIRRLRVWPPLLTLLFLSPMVGEVISGSTPPLQFIQPFGLIFLPTLYGISAILIHEIIVRRRLGWHNVLLLGAAFGIFQEALVVQTWFNFVSPRSPSHSMGGFGVFWQTNWVWALNLTIYHAVISIAVPLILINLFYPRRAALPWLRKRGIIGLSVWMFVLCGLLTYQVGFKSFVAGGYKHPPLFPYLAAVALTFVALLLGCCWRFPASRLPQAFRGMNRTPAHEPVRRAPWLWTVRLACFGLTTLFFLMQFFLPATHIPAVLAILLSLVLLAFSLWRVHSWSTRAGWGARHRLAVAIGIIMFFVFLFGPLIEFALHLPLHTGQTVFNLVVFVGLMLFDQRIKRRMSLDGDAYIAN